MSKHVTYGARATKPEPSVILEVRILPTLLAELDRHAKEARVRPATLAVEILQVWCMERREKERTRAALHAVASVEERESALYGCSIRDVE